MENESNISLGGTIILLALFAQKYIFGQRYRRKHHIEYVCETRRIKELELDNATLHALIWSLF